MAILLSLALIILATLSSILKSLSVPRDHSPSDDAPETDYYTVDIDEAEKRGTGPGADSGTSGNNHPAPVAMGRDHRPVVRAG